MTRKVCIDGLFTWVTTTDVGSGTLIRLHPVSSSDPADVYSVSSGNVWTVNQNNGSNEAFTVVGDFLYVTPVGMPVNHSHGYRWVPA